MAISYFLGANSPSGFVSLFDDWIGAADTDKVYIIKGAPGSGKSGFMRRIAAEMEHQGEQVEYICCSADPGSLDGIRVPALGLLMVDGTAPHAIEPRYPYALESYLNLGDFVDEDAVRARRDELIRATAAHRQEVARVTRCIAAAAAIQENIQSIVISGEIIDRITKRARGVVKRELTRGSGGVLRKRYLNGISASGETIHWDTVAEQCGRVYAIDNSFGFAPFFLTPIMTGALELGQEVVACYNPADSRLEHLILPGLSLGFVSIRPGRIYPGEAYRHIRLDAMVPPERIRVIRQKLKFLQKTQASLLREASSAMEQTKRAHDEIEGLFTPNVDFDGVDALAGRIIGRLTAGAPQAQ